MVVWSVKTLSNNCVEEHELWTKNNLTIRRIIIFNCGEFSVYTKDSTAPTFELKVLPGSDSNLQSVDMYNCGYDSDLVELEGVVSENVIWPADLTPFARDNLLIDWRKDPYSSWEKNGWQRQDVEVWFSGPLEVEKVKIL